MFSSLLADLVLFVRILHRFSSNKNSRRDWSGFRSEFPCRGQFPGLMCGCENAPEAGAMAWEEWRCWASHAAAWARDEIWLLGKMSGASAAADGFTEMPVGLFLIHNSALDHSTQWQLQSPTHHSHPRVLMSHWPVTWTFEAWTTIYWSHSIWRCTGSELGLD